MIEHLRGNHPSTMYLFICSLLLSLSDSRSFLLTDTQTHPGGAFAAQQHRERETERKEYERILRDKAEGTSNAQVSLTSIYYHFVH